MAKQLNVNLAFTADTSQAKAQLESLKNSLTNIGNLSNLNRAGKIIEEDLYEASKAAYQLKIALESATDFKTGKLNLTTFSRELKQNSISLTDTRVALSKLGAEGNKAFLSLATAIQSADAPLVNLGSRAKSLVNTFANTARWQIASSALHAIVGEISHAYSFAQSLDKSLNDIRIVSGASADEMARFAKQANQSAQALSTTTKKYTDAALIFYQQGLNDKEVKERTDATIKMANVTGEAVNDVSSYMTAVWNNFNKDGTQSVEHFGDVMTKLGADTAASTEEIAGGLEKFAAVANTIGLSFDYATSAITTIVDRTRQSEDVVGTALKTIFSRIQGLKQGETLDDGTDLNKYSQGLASVGVQIKDATGNLRDMDDILDDIGSTWETLSREQKVALAQTVAGVRQYSQFMALFDNWDFMQQNLNAAATADGTLDKQATIYADSWEAARKRVAASAESIYDSLIDEEFFKDFDNGIAKTLQAIQTLIDNIGGLKSVLLGVGVLVTKIFKTQMANSIRIAGQAISDFGVLAYNKRLKKKTTDEEYSQQKKKTSTEQVREQTNREVNVMAQTLRGNKQYVEANTYKTISDVQNQILDKEGKMSEFESKMAASLMDRLRSNGEILIQLQSSYNLVDKTLEREIQISNILSKTISSHKEKQSNEEQEYLAIQNQVKELQKLINLYSEYKALTIAKTEGNITEIERSRLNSISTQLRDIVGLKGKGKKFPTDKFDFESEIQSRAGTIAIRTDRYVNNYEKENRQSEDENKNQRTQNVKDLSKKTQEAAKLGLELHNVDGNLKESKADAEAFLATITDKTPDAAESLVSVSNGVMSLGFAFNSLTTAWESINDAFEDGKMSLSEFSNVFLSLSMAIPMLVDGYKSLKLGINGVTEAIGLSMLTEEAQIAIKKLNNASIVEEIALAKRENAANLQSILTNKLGIEGELAEAAAREVSKASSEKEIAIRLRSILVAEVEGTQSKKNIALKIAETVVEKTLNKTKLAGLALRTKGLIVIAAIAAAIGLLVLAIKGLVNWWNKDANALKEAQQATEEAKSSFESAKSSYEDLISSIEDHNDAVESIKALTEGTTEFKQAVQEANEKVIQLLDSYPQLAQYINKDQKSGLLTISKAGQEAILKEENAKVGNSYRNYARAQVKENEAENTNNITQFARNSGFNIVDNSDERRIINGLLKDYQNENIGAEALVYSNQELADKYGVAVSTIDNLVNNGLNQLIVSLDANTTANDLLTDQISSSTLSQHLEGYDDYAYKDSLNAYFTDQTKANAGRESVLKGHSEVDNLSNDDLAKAYALLTGIDESQITERGGSAMKITDENGEEKEVKHTEMREALYGEAANMYELEKMPDFINSVDAVGKEVSNLFSEEKYGKDISDKLTIGLTNAITTAKDTAIPDFLSNLSNEEFTAVKEALNNGSLDSAINDFYSQNSSYFQDLGYKTAKNFTDAFNVVIHDNDLFNQEEAARQAEITAKQNWQGAVDNLASELEVDSNAVEGYAETLQDLYPQLEGNTEATMAMAEANIKFSKGFDSLVSAIDDNEEALKDLNSTSWLTQEALAEVGNAYEEMTGVNVSNDFIKEHLSEIKKLADGDISVLEELGEAAAKDFVAHLEIPDEDIANFNNVLDQLKAEGTGLDIGATVSLDDTQYIDSLNEMIKAGDLTADQVKTAFNSMGYDPEVETTPVEQSNTTHYDLSGDGILSFLKAGVDATATTTIDVPIIKPDGIKKISTPSSLGSSIHPSQTTSGKKKKDGGSKKEMDRYHTIKKQIASLQTEYERLETARDRAWGKNSVNIIDQEIKKTDQLIKKQKEYISQIKKNLSSDKAAIKKYGAKFDASGNVTNYRTLFKKYGQNEKFQKALENYENTVETLQEAETEKINLKNQKQDLKYQKIITEVEYKIELNESDRKITETFFNILNDDIYKTAEAMKLLNEQIDEAFAINGIYQTEFNDLSKAWKKGQISQADYKEGLESVRDSLLEEIETLNELDQTMLHYYGDTLEKAKNELDEYMSMLDAAADKLKHFQKVQELSGNGVDYTKTLELIKAQEKVAKNSYDVAKQWYESRKASQEEIETRLASMDKDKDSAAYELEMQKWKDAVKATNEAYSTMADYRETYLELAEEEYKTTIDSIYDYADKKMSGGLGLDNLLNSMSNLKTYADEYLTKTNKIYETNKMLRQLNRDMDKTSNTAAKQRLSNFAKEIESAQKQNKLSNLELEILQAKYKQLQAQIALEEAQNAKDKVRLSRDSEGNYGYVYTANKDNISDAQQALDDANNDLYNIRLKAYNDYAEKKFQAQKEYLEKSKAIDEDETLSAKEKEEAKARLHQEYINIIEAYGDLANIAQQDDARIQQEAWAAAYKKEIADATEWKEIIDDTLKKSQSTFEDYHKNIDTMVKETKEGHDSWSDAIKDVTTKNDELKKKILKEVIPALDANIDKADDETDSYKKQRDAILKLIDAYKKLVSNIKTALRELSNFETKSNAIKDTKIKSNGGADGNGTKGKGGKTNTSGSGGKINSSDKNENNPSSNQKKGNIYGYRIKINGSIYKQKLNAFDTKNAAKKAAKEDSKNLISSSKPTSGSWLGNIYEFSGMPKNWYTVNANDGLSYSAATLSALESKVKSAYSAKNPRAQRAAVNRYWDIISKKIKTSHFDTGGYTGEWGNSGKIAMLHQKELVLNAEDTKNFLAGIEVLRDVVQRIDLQAMYAGSTNIAAASVGSSKSTLAQEVNIHAEFPNAVNHNEIEQAFDTLINRAAQYANRK